MVKVIHGEIQMSREISLFFVIEAKLTHIIAKPSSTMQGRLPRAAVDDPALDLGLDGVPQRASVVRVPAARGALLPRRQDGRGQLAPRGAASSRRRRGPAVRGGRSPGRLAVAHGRRASTVAVGARRAGGRRVLRVHEPLHVAEEAT